METQSTQIHNFHEGDRFHEHYRLLEHVGSGGFADVWKAKDELVDTIVALKIYTRLDKEGISELAKEYKDMRGIKHPNLLTGNHFDASGNIPYLEMDYCDGGSLYGKMGKMSNSELHHVAQDIAEGLAYLHKEGIVHQDIKPENILYDTIHNRYLLSDFGISSKSRTRLSHSVNKANMTLSMTEAYAPPEKFSGNMADIEPNTKGDIFSLGMTLFELAAGMLPFTPPMATGREMLYSQGRLQLDYSNIQDAQLRKIVETCTKYSKAERPTAEEVVTMVNEPQHGFDKERPTGKKPTEKINIDSQKKDVYGSLKPTVPIYTYESYVGDRSTRVIPHTHIEKQPQFSEKKVKVGDGQKYSQQSKPQEPSKPMIAHNPAPKPKTNRNWLWIVVVIVAILLVILIGKQFTSGGVRMDGNDLLFSCDGTEYRYKMVYVSGGTYTMGCSSEQGGDCYSDEKPVHSVTVSGFYMGQTEVTQALWKAVMGNNPSYRKGDNLPVEQVSYNDVKDFIRKLNSMTGETFRLPTEAEWEYAARGGNSSRGYKYSGSDNIGSVAWYGDNSDSKTHPVAQKQANELGLYDMSGNVWEWCNDWYRSYSSNSQTDSRGSSWGSFRVYRGGSWGSYAGRCRVSYRHSYSPSYRYDILGFRLAR